MLPRHQESFSSPRITRTEVAKHISQEKTPSPKEASIARGSKKGPGSDRNSFPKGRNLKSKINFEKYPLQLGLRGISPQFWLGLGLGRWGWGRGDKAICSQDTDSPPLAVEVGGRWLLCAGTPGHDRSHFLSCDKAACSPWRPGVSFLSPTGSPRKLLRMT